MGTPSYERPRPFVPKDRPKIRPSPNETPTRPRGIEAVQPTRRLGGIPKDRPTQQSLEAVKLAEQESQIARARLGKTTPPPGPTPRPSNPATAIVPARDGEIDIDPFAMDEEDPIAAMRALCPQGNAEAALALATAITSELDEPAAFEPASGTFRPDALAVASSAIEPAPFSDAMLDDAFDDVAPPDDPFGGLIPVDDEEELGAADSSEPDELDFGLGDDPFGGLVPVEPEPLSHSAIVATGNLPIVAMQTPRLLIDAREIPTLPIDPRGAFMLTLVDGIQSLEEILDTCAMPQAEALDLIDKLRLMGVIEV